jgi:hypothetical protein
MPIQVGFDNFDRISLIRDYRHVRYVAADAELVLAPEAKPTDDGAAH